MTPEQILDKAADYIHEHGWTRGVLMDAFDRVCLQGAIEKVAQCEVGTQCGVGTQANDAWNALCRSLGFGGPTAWNDRVCKDADEAVEALKKAKEFL